MESFLLTSGTRQGCPLSLPFVNIGWKALARTIGKRKRKSRITKQKSNLPLLKNDLISCIEISKRHLKKKNLLELISSIKLNIQIGTPNTFVFLHARDLSWKAQWWSYFYMLRKPTYPPKSENNSSTSNNHKHSPQI